MSVKKMILCAIFAVLIAVGAFLKIPIPVVPFTMQLFFILLAGQLLGSRLGALSALIYLLLGLAGVPVFAEGGGIWYVLKPSFGYIIGFVIGTFVTGLIIEKFEKYSFIKSLLANFAGLIIVYLVGMIYFYVISNYVIESPIGIWSLFLYCFLLVVPGDICLCFLAAFLTKKLRPIVRAMLEEK